MESFGLFVSPVHLCSLLILAELGIDSTAKEPLQRLLHDLFPHPHSFLAAVCTIHLIQCGFQNAKIVSEKQYKAVLNDDPLLAYASEAWAFHALQSLDLNETKQHIARFVMDIKAFPAFTSFDRTFGFDILTPLHVIGLYRLPLNLIDVEQLSKYSPNTTTKIFQQSPLMMASYTGHNSLAEFLLDRSEIQVNLINKSRCSALMLAAYTGQKGIITRLVSRPDVQVNLVDKSGRSALMLAAHFGYDGIVSILVAHPEIQVNLVRNNGWTALMLAARSGNEGSMKALLTSDGINVNAVNQAGDTAMKIAAEEGHEAVVQMLLAMPGIDIAVKSTDGRTAVSAAAARGHTSIVKILRKFKS